MSIPLRQQFDIGLYLMKQKIKGTKRYPLVLMLEPLFRCNLACAGCGKIDYPDDILNQRVPVDAAMRAMDECGAPIMVIAGGEPLLHKEIVQIVDGAIARGKYVYLCTNALLMDKKIDQFKHLIGSNHFTWTVHLDGDRDHHDQSVCQEGVYDKAVAAIKRAIAMGFRTNINCTLFNNAEPENVGAFFDDVMALGVNAITVSPGYAYERAPDQQHFLNKKATKNLFRSILRLGRKSVEMGRKKWQFSQSGLFMDFLAGNQTYGCTPWGNPTYNYFGWQRPCYLLGEGYVQTFRELMEETEWDQYGTGNYEKCADCMVHCGFEATAVSDTLANPLKALKVFLMGPDTEGPMAPEIPLDKQRSAQFVFSSHVEQALAKIKADKAAGKVEAEDAAE
jgi:hopanoid biosynthesis associated radical SAM protein HpnH